VSSKAAPKRALGRAHKIGRALYAATPLPAVEQLIGAMANPSSGIRFVLGIARRGAQRVSEVQSVIFDKLKWALEDAKAWLRKHGFAVPKVDEGATYWRFRQQDPKKYMEFRTITPGEGSANPSGPRRWLVPYHRDKINYEDVGYLPLALEHDVGFAGDRIYRVVEQTPQGFRRIIDDVSPYRSRREALERLREIAAERGYLQSGPLASHTNPLSYEPVYHIEDITRIFNEAKRKARAKGMTLHVVNYPDGGKSLKDEHGSSVIGFKKISQRGYELVADFRDKFGLENPATLRQLQIVDARGERDGAAYGGPYPPSGTAIRRAYLRAMAELADDLKDERGMISPRDRANYRSTYYFAFRRGAGRGRSGSPSSLRQERHGQNPAYDVIMGPVSVQEWHVSDSKARGRAAELRKLGYQATLRKVRRVRTPDGIVDITVLTIRPGKTGDKYLEKVPGSKVAKWRPNPCQDDRESPESGPVQSTIPAPPEIRLPFSSVVDHGLVLVHELDGSPRNYLHEVSIKDQDYDAQEYARDAGYHLSHGWVDQDGQQYWVYRKSYPLGVAEWREGKSAGADNPEDPGRAIWERHKQLTEKIRKSHPEWSWDMVEGYVAGIETAEGISKDPSDPRLMEQIRHHYQDAIRTNDDYGWAYAHGLTERGKTLGLWSSSPEELFRKVLRNPLQKGADNPEPEAAALYEDFHGRPPSEVKEIVTEREEHEWLTQLGTLVELKLNTLTNLDASIKFSGADAPDLCSSEDGRQLYIEGGNQEVDLAALKMDGDDWRKDSMVLGVIKEITYRTEKHFHKFDPIDYYHKLGEETGELPYLVYDPNNKLLSISGGQYQVKPEGIVN